MRRIFLGSLLVLVPAVWAACDADPGTNDSLFPPISQHGGTPGADGGGSTLADASLGTDATVTPVAVTIACADLAAARCKRDDACTGGLHNVAVYGDEPTCESRTSALCVADLAAPSTAQTAVTVEACAASIATQSCADAFDEVPTAACMPLAGSLTTGAACISSSQCASTYCAIPANSACGSCAAVPKGSDHCATAADCGERGGLTCAGGVCIPIGQTGSACTSAIPCGYGLSCVGASASVAGTCQPAAADAGAACDPTGATGAACSPDLELRCDPVARVCEPIALAAAGKPCGELDGGVAGCAAGECVITVPDAGTIVDAGADADDGGDSGDDASAVDAGPPPGPPTSGLCVGAVKEGAACDLAVGPPCLAPAKCVTGADGGMAGTCALPNGATCK